MNIFGIATTTLGYSVMTPIRLGETQANLPKNDLSQSMNPAIGIHSRLRPLEFTSLFSLENSSIWGRNKYVDIVAEKQPCRWNLLAWELPPFLLGQNTFGHQSHLWRDLGSIPGEQIFWYWGIISDGNTAYILSHCDFYRRRTHVCIRVNGNVAWLDKDNVIPINYVTSEISFDGKHV